MMHICPRNWRRCRGGGSGDDATGSGGAVGAAPRSLWVATIQHRPAIVNLNLHLHMYDLDKSY
eukprot:4234297-Amphidinium_carterae.1